MPGTYDALTIRGGIVHVRAVRPQDAEALRYLHTRVSSRSRYLRFFSAGSAPDGEVRRLTRPPDDKHLALLVEEAGQVICVASYEVVDDTTADFAILVDDARQGEGIGTLALEHLAAAARAAGLARLVGDVLAENATMLRVSRDLVPGVVRTVGDDYATVQISVPTVPDEAALTAVGVRDRTAEHRSLRPLLAPRSVAVVGTLGEPGSAGHEVLRALLAGGFRGTVHAVDPLAYEVLGCTAHRRVSAIGAPVDLAVIAVSGPAVRDVLEDCAGAGTHAAVVLGSSADDLSHLVRAHGLRLVGPASLGVVNTDPSVRLAATVAPGVPGPGGLAVAAQSRAVGVAILDAAARAGTGISTFVSLGDKADVSGNDLLTYWYDDPATRAVALYLESFGNPRRFAWVARMLGRRKPVLAVTSMRPAGGVDSGVAVDSLFRQAGVIRADTLGELLDAARVLVGQPLPAGNRLAVVGNAGGLRTLAIDAAARVGLVVPPSSFPPDTAALAALAAVLASGEVDMVAVMVAATLADDALDALRDIGEAADAAPGVPVVAVVVGVPDAPTVLGRRQIPVYALPEDAVRALGHAAAYAAWRREPIGARPVLSRVDGRRARSLVDAALAAGRAGWQPPDVAAALLACYGIPTAGTTTAPDAGVELVAGVVHDHRFGSLVTVALGGPYAELVDDRAYRLLPVTTLDAARMWRSLRGAPLLTGHRGSAPVDTGALEDLLLRLGRLAEDLPEVARLDLDPVLVATSGAVAYDVKLRLAATGDEPDPHLRALSPGPE